MKNEQGENEVTEVVSIQDFKGFRGIRAAYSDMWIDLKRLTRDIKVEDVENCLTLEGWKEI